MKARSPVFKMLPCYVLALALCIMISFVGSDAVTVMVERATIPDRSCIAIDAGHGGIDGGAISCNGIQESGINLEIAQRLDDLFHLLGYETMLLRKDDTSLHTEGSTIAKQKISDLKNRVQMVNDRAPALLISIHQNTFSEAKYHGAQVFYSGSNYSQLIAEKLQESFIKTINPESNRKAKSAKGIYLMEHISCPGILIECGFLTNPQEEALLRSAPYQKKISCVVATTVSNWKENKETASDEAVP